MSSISTNSRSFFNALIVTSFIRVLIACVLVLWEFASPTPPHPNDAHYVNMTPNLTLVGQLLVKWDSYWYLNIVDNGYEGQAEGTGSSNLAFAPLYPACIYLLTRVGIEAWIGGVLISLACYLAMLYYLHEFGASVHSPRLGRALMIFTAVFPSAWVFHMVYAESMFCLILTAFLVHRAKGNYLRAGAFALLLPLTRIVGIVVVPAVVVDLAIRARRTRAIPQGWTTLVGAVAGVAILGAVYTAVVGAPFPFLDAGAEWPSRAEVSGRLFPLLWSLAAHFGDRPEAALYGIFLVTYLAACVVLIRERRDAIGWFCAFYLFALLQMPYICHMRFLLPCVPLHMVLVWRVIRSKPLFVVLCVLLGALQILLARLSLTWHVVT